MNNINSNEQFKLKLRFYGYSSTGATIQYNQALSQIAEILSDTSYIKSFDLEHYSRKNVSLVTRIFMERLFNLHQVIGGSEIEISNLIKQRISSPQELLTKLQKRTSLISPFSIPLSYYEGDSMVGNTIKPVILTHNDELLQKEPVIFSRIILGNNLTPISSGTYCHEITHTQLESRKGTIQEYTNKEVISILIEKIFALEIDNTNKVLSKSQLTRFKDMLDAINALKNIPNKIATSTEDLEKAIYISGTLQALRLFDIYKDGSEEVKNEMIANIQKVFDGQQTAEEFLSFYNVTYENSQDISLVKKHLG